MAHLTLWYRSWSRSARLGSDLPWTIERSYASRDISSMGVPIDGSPVALGSRIFVALPAGSEPSGSVSLEDQARAAAIDAAIRTAAALREEGYCSQGGSDDDPY
jgi:hypothetical protein